MAARTEQQEMLLDAAKLWWVMLVSGMIWTVIALVVLRINETSVTTVGVIMGVVFIYGVLAEVVAIGFSTSTGWRIWHALLALVFLLAGIWSFTEPKQAFWALASVFGFLLLLVGILDIARALVSKDEDSGWWLTLIVGILFVALAFWTSQQIDPVKGKLLLFAVGIFALLRGVTQIAFAFALRHAGKELAAA
jgi:uncharacterized membrane protein HdeD (DUF308 family)